MPRELRRVHYEGSVQGVGFRYTSCQIASNYDVNGFVRNLPDGRVLLVIEGESEDLDAFLKEVAARFDANISAIDIGHEPATGDFEGFVIRH